MSSLPSTRQDKKRNSTIIILVATILALFLGTVFLWQTGAFPGNTPVIRPGIEVQTGENQRDTLPTSEILSPAANPELRIQERFRADRTAAAAGSILHNNPELKTLDYAQPAVVVDLYANPELKSLDYPSQSTP